MCFHSCLVNFYRNFLALVVCAYALACFYVDLVVSMMYNVVDEVCYMGSLKVKCLDHMLFLVHVSLVSPISRSKVVLLK